MRTIKTFCGIAPLLEEAGSIHGPGPRPHVQTNRLVFGHARPGLRRPISFKFALVADGQPAVVAVPLRGTLARVRRDASSPVLAFLVTDRGAAVLARPLRRAGARVRPRAVAAVAARRRADGRRAVGVEPAVPVWKSTSRTLQFVVSRGRSEVLLAPVGRVYQRNVVSEFEPKPGPRCRDSETRPLSLGEK